MKFRNLCALVTAMTFCFSTACTTVFAGTHAADAAPTFALAGQTIVIDAGHGGPDSGARGDGGIMEKDITLKIAKKVAALCQQAGAYTYLTRSVDDDLATERDRAMHRRQQRDLRNRTRLAKSKNPDLFISVHCNAVPSPVWRGAHVIYMDGNPEGEQFAKIMQRRFKELLLPTNRKADGMNTLYLLRRIPCPAVLAEVGFLSNPQEASALVTDRYQNKVAFAIYMSALDYVNHESTLYRTGEGAS